MLFLNLVSNRIPSNLNVVYSYLSQSWISLLIKEPDTVDTARDGFVTATEADLEHDGHDLQL